MLFSFRPTRGRRLLAIPFVAALSVSLAGVTSSAVGDPAPAPAGERNIALLRAVLHSSYATNNYFNTGHLVTDGIYADPTAPAAARPVVSASTGTAASGFDYTLNNAYWASTGTLNASNPQWLAIDLLQPTAVRSYRVQPHCNGSGTGLATNYPTAWELQGSADGADWTTLDAKSGQTGANQLPCRGGTFPLTGANYQNYRILVTAASATTARIGEL
ncbi:MAG: discoidin domain-containing protein, partial [Bifidobacteriaceae bacterium]|nr:discoidin domain-containing protein [Bifidobacteriaceae bacterium]